VERQRQLKEYLRLINDGISYEDAMHAAFGDIRRLNSELLNYAGRSGFKVLQLPFRPTDFGEITVRELSASEQALIPQEITLSRGVSAREAESFAREVRQISNRFVDDPYALVLLAEAELLAGHRDRALTAADRLLGINPDDPRGLLQKALVEVDALKAASSAEPQAWDAPRKLLVRANNLSPNNPLILEAYYDSFVAQGMLPPEAAQNALYTAMELAPSDRNLRYKVAADFERRNMIAEAIAIIRSEAYRLPDRHQETEKERRRREEAEEKYRDAQRPQRESAREMLERLEKRLAEQPASS
jgi:tetratricopeptide (TPR) repeat protein